MCYWTPKFCYERFFTNQVIAQIELWNNSDKYENKVYVLPKHLDESSNASSQGRSKLTKMSKDQADYISVKHRAFKLDTYRY